MARVFSRGCFLLYYNLSGTFPTSFGQFSSHSYLFQKNFQQLFLPKPKPSPSKLPSLHNLEVPASTEEAYAHTISNRVSPI